MNFIRRITNKVRNVSIIWINEFRFFRSAKHMKLLKNAHKGKRCFIVGNGPSLNVDDLKKLKDEVCFGTHRIYEIFDKTDWRPTYYCAQDQKLIQDSSKEIGKIVAKRKFIGMVKSQKYPQFKKTDYLQLHIESFYPELPNFSEDIAEGIYEGFTVSYMCLQLAAYMGFDEIYLLGIDHNYSKTKSPDGEIVEDLQVQDHFSAKDVITNVPQLYKSTLAYEKAELFSRQCGFRIYNATRGGKLEAFERVEFDKLF